MKHKILFVDSNLKSETFASADEFSIGFFVYIAAFPFCLYQHMENCMRTYRPEY